MQTLTQIKALLAEHALAPRHALGQNFLIDHNLIRRLVDASGVGPGDAVLEIGPGTGTLTEELLAHGCRVVACELDDGLASLLARRIPTLGLPGTFTLIRGDCLESFRKVNREAISALGHGPFSLVANLPYAAGTPLMLALLTDHPGCRRMAVTIQKEVADRLTASPGCKEFGTLGILAQSLAEITPIATLPRECFWPRPDVTSAMVLLTRREVPITDDPASLAALCQRLFSKRRKQLGAILGRDGPAPGATWPPGIRPEQRPEELTIEQWAALARLCPPG